MRHFFIALLAFFVMSNQCFAFQAPVSNMQNSVSGVIQSKLAARGINTNDPRTAQTITGSTSAVIGSALLGAANASTVAGATWATVAAGAALGGAIALTGVAVALAVGGAYAWLFKDDGKIQIGDNPASPNTPAGLAPPTIIYCGDNFVCGPTPQAVCSGQPTSRGNFNNQPGTYFHEFESDGHCHLRYKFDSLSTVPDFGADTDPRKITSNTTSCPGIGLTATAGKCPASNFPEPAAAPVKSPDQAISDVPAVERVKPLNPLIVADIADAMWREAAAAPGYAGIPYDASDPITATDAATYQAAHPNTWPTVGDFISPQTAPTGAPANSPFVLPTSPTPVQTQDPSTPPQTGTNPSTEPLENLGPDPGIGAPSIEPIPTAQQILQPLLNLFPTLRNFVVPNHNAVCPKWSVHLFDRDVQLQDHCPMLEQARPTAQATMAAVWILIALFIVLAA